MLVVSRKQNQTVVFPNLGISIEILRVASSSVSVGVTAPDDVRILRGELLESDIAVARGQASSGVSHRTENQELRNQLSLAQAALRSIQQLLENGQPLRAEQCAADALEALNESTLGDRSSSQCAEGKSCYVDSAQKRVALVVEDDETLRQQVIEYLESCGYRVATVKTSSAAIEYLEQNKPVAVVLNMETPRLNGSQTAIEICRNPAWKDIAIFGVRGSSSVAVPARNLSQEDLSASHNLN